MQKKYVPYFSHVLIKTSHKLKKNFHSTTFFLKKSAVSIFDLLQTKQVARSLGETL